MSTGFRRAATGERTPEVPGIPERYAPWQAAESLIREERRRVAAVELHRCRAFPERGTPCLEVGVGAGGWFPDLLSWGMAGADLHGIDIDVARLDVTRQGYPGSALEAASADRIPWPDQRFGLVVASTVFTSILDETRRKAVAGEIVRVLRPGGALVWYDFAVPSYGNQLVRPVPRAELVALFPTLKATVRRVTLAPPLARAIAGRSWTLATILNAVPLLCTHLLGVLVKPLPDDLDRHVSV